MSSVHQLCRQYMIQGDALFGRTELGMHQAHRTRASAPVPVPFISICSYFIKFAYNWHLTAKLLPTSQRILGDMVLHKCCNDGKAVSARLQMAMLSIVTVAAEVQPVRSLIS